MKQPTDLKQGWSTDYDNEQYHHGPLKYLISSSDLKNFARSPAHYREAKQNPEPSTPAMTFGSAFHSIVMGFPDEVTVAPTINRRTKAGKAEYSAFLAASAGKYVVSQAEMNAIEGMCEAVSHHKFARSLSETPHREITGIFADRGTDLWCKIRPDLIDLDRLIISDFKSCVDASEAKFTRTIFDYKYNWSAAWYKHGAEMITDQRFAFVIIAVEKTPPYGVNCFNIAGRAIRVAIDHIFEMTGEISDCFRKNQWPSYPQYLIDPDMPGWIK